MCGERRESGDNIPIRPAVAPVNAPPRIQPQGRQPGCFVVPTPRDGSELPENDRGAGACPPRPTDPRCESLLLDHLTGIGLDFVAGRGIMYCYSSR